MLSGHPKIPGRWEMIPSHRVPGGIHMGKFSYAGTQLTLPDGNESDGSEEFQNGVQRVRAITEIWDKKTLITMFVL